MPKIKCIAFDADNTLYATREAAKLADRAAIEILANTANQPAEKLYKEWQEIVSTIENSSDPKMRNRTYSYSKLAEKYDAVNVVPKMYKKMMNTLLKKIKLTTGVKEILTKLKARSLKLFVITEDEDREKALAKINTLGIFDYFDGIITSTDVETMKPSEKYYTKLLEKFSPNEILVVGDSFEKDLTIPKQLGMQTLLVKQPGDLSKIETLVK